MTQYCTCSIFIRLMSEFARSGSTLSWFEQDGDNINNYVEVQGHPGNAAARNRLLSEDGTLTDEERRILLQKLDALSL